MSMAPPLGIFGRGKPSSGLRYATIVVAASNSLHPSAADYTCTGTNDDVTINAAIAAAASVSLQWGRVLLMEGQYNLGNSIVLKSGITLEGQGFGSYVVGNNGNYHMITTTGHTTGWAVRHLQLQWGTGSQTAAPVAGLSMINVEATNEAWIESNLFLSGITHHTSTYPLCILIAGQIGVGNVNQVVVANNIAIGGGIGGILIGGSTPARADGISIVNNYMTALESGIDLISSGFEIEIIGNTLDVPGTWPGVVNNGISLQALGSTAAPQVVTISGNTIVDAGDNGILLDGASDCYVIGNSVDGGGQYSTQPGATHGNSITLTDTHGSCTNNVVSGNGDLEGDEWFFICLVSTVSAHGVWGNVVTNNNAGDASLHGIVLTGASCTDNLVSSNVITGWASLHPTGNWDGIFIDNGASRNSVQGNLVRGDVSAGVATTTGRYGINVNAASCTANFVTNNDLHSSGTTGSFSDSGTGTVTTAGNRL